MRTRGLHHVTAIASDPQRNLDVYTELLGLRLVKRTVNFDDPGAYHFYFANADAQPGTLLTFFPWPGAGRGRQGTRQAVTTAFSIPPGALDFWTQRLNAAGVRNEPLTRFGQRGLSFEDHDGMRLELFEQPLPASAAWLVAGISAEVAIRGLHSVTLAVEGYEATAAVLVDLLGLSAAGAEQNRFRYVCDAGGVGASIDVLCTPDALRGTLGVGIVHHVAWRAADLAQLEQCRAALASTGYNVTPILDRAYFRSIYFREPGGVLFEVATDDPGFSTDESPVALGAALKLPSWLEPRRTQIEAALPRIEGPAVGRRG